MFYLIFKNFQDILPVSNISIIATADKVIANWDKLKCVDHYNMKLKRLNSKSQKEIGI